MMEYTTQQATEVIDYVQILLFGTDGELLEWDAEQERKSRTAITIYRNSVNLHYSMDSQLIKRAIEAGHECEIKVSGMIYIHIIMELSDGTEIKTDVCLS